jgi:hypothetical protein
VTFVRHVTLPEGIQLRIHARLRWTIWESAH